MTMAQASVQFTSWWGLEPSRCSAHQRVLRQRVGKITVDLSTPRDDVSVMEIPASCTAYVTGKGGQGLRRIEGDSGTLMFFGKPTTDPEDAPEKLIICGLGLAGAVLYVYIHI